MNEKTTRRDILRLGTGIAAGTLSLATIENALTGEAFAAPTAGDDKAPKATRPPLPPEDMLARMLEGNERFVRGSRAGPRRTSRRSPRRRPRVPWS